MKPEELHHKYQLKKDIFHNYINNIKKNSVCDIYTIINTTLIKNPYNSHFAKKFFLSEYIKENKTILFFKILIKFYIEQFLHLISYILSFIIFKIYYKKKKVILDNHIVIDVFFLINNIINDNEFTENYFGGLYTTLTNYNINYIFIPRIYGISKNPFKLIKFFKIINKDKRDFLFEFELLSFKDILFMIPIVLKYPFKTLRLLQQEKTLQDKIFNNELIRDIGATKFDSFSRYIFGKNISTLSNKLYKIYSWSEFQVIERSFNYGVRTNSKNIKLYGCQLYINYETYFNSYIDDIDYKQRTSFHDVLVSGKYYIKERKLINYRKGVSFRYKNVFLYQFSSIGTKILLLGSYIQDDTRHMLDIVSSFENILFKNHPAVNIKKIGPLQKNISVVDDDIYKLFNSTEIVVATASGTAVEAVACGIPVIIIASQFNLTANPLVNRGKGKIWDIAFTKNEVNKLHHQLVNYRRNNINEIKEISNWYKSNFFIEPTEQNIINAFELEIRET